MEWQQKDLEMNKDLRVLPSQWQLEAHFVRVHHSFPWQTWSCYISVLDKHADINLDDTASWLSENSFGKSLRMSYSLTLACPLWDNARCNLGPPGRITRAAGRTPQSSNAAFGFGRHLDDLLAFGEYSTVAVMMTTAFLPGQALLPARLSRLGTRHWILPALWCR